MIRLAMALVMPLAAQAQTFALPAGCTGFLTVQRANCTVVNYYTCDSDPADWRRLVLMFPDGLDTFMIGDREGTWIETANNFSGVTDRFESAVDPMSMSTLLATGLDTYDFLILSDQEGISRITGTDRLTGGRMTIDGVVLLQATSEIRAESADGAPKWSFVTNDLVMESEGLFLGGLSHGVQDGQAMSTDASPVRIVRPGAEGFMAAQAAFGCESLADG